MGLELAKTNKYDLILSDIALPYVDGLTILRKIRNLEIRTPVIMMTSLTGLKNELDSFEFGGDIFHKKPLNYELLLLQINMLLNRHFISKNIKIGDLSIDTSKAVIYKSGVKLDLSFKEFNLLTMLCSAPGDVFTRQEIISVLSNRITDIEEGSVDTLVSRLRKKVGKYKGKESIETVVKRGYRLSLEYLKP